MSSASVQGIDGEPSTSTTGKPKKTAMIIAVVIVIVLVVAIIGFLSWPPTPPSDGQNNTQNNITSVIETQIVTVHTSGGTDTHRNVIEHPTLAGNYSTGAPMTFGEFYRYSGTGRMNLTAIVANTTGFSFASSIPSLPIVMPNATQDRLELSMTFSTPSYQYNGSFEFIVYLDQFPDDLDSQQNYLASVLEVQYVTTHFGSLSNTVKYLHWHNDTVGFYPVGETMNITEPFWNVGSGTMSITSIESNTSGFTFIGSVPSLPIPVPNSPDQSSGNVTVVISFSVPTVQYIGDFEYVVYFDEYIV